MDQRIVLTGLLAVLWASGAHAFIAPQEIPSILSLVYSNIPPIKKGTDSRVGFGYRLGEHADFQVLFELGPQKNTKEVGEAFSTPGETSKRHVNQEDYSGNSRPVVSTKVPKDSPNPVGSQWLANWSQDVRQQQKRRPLVTPTSADGAPTQPLQTRPFIAESSLHQLQQLYGIPLPSATQQQPERPSAPAPVPFQPLTTGTLPASSQAVMAAQLDKVRFGNSVRPRVPQAPASRNEAKISASLMDIDLS